MGKFKVGDFVIWKKGYVEGYIERIDPDSFALVRFKVAYQSGPNSFWECLSLKFNEIEPVDTSDWKDLWENNNG